jgi:hypothetical protein
MSAFVVDKTHIDLLVRAADEYGRRGTGSGFRYWKTDDGTFGGVWGELDRYAEELPSYQDHLEKVTPSQFGQILLRDAGELPGPIDAYYIGPYIYEDPGVLPTPEQVFNLIDCLDYQSCETDDWETTQAATILRTLRETVCRHVDGYATPSGWVDLDRIVAERKEATTR